MAQISTIVFDGIAKPTPANWPVVEKMAELMPITSPLILSKGPPALPGLIGASVWRISGIVKPSSSWAGICLPTPLTMPLVREPESPKGFTKSSHTLTYSHVRRICKRQWEKFFL